MLQITTKTYNELTKEELYQVLQLRSEVFVVEQDCVYQDIDFKDQKAMHILGFKNEKLVAYTRIFKPGDYFENASIGRVVVAEKERINGFGHVIFKASIKAINEFFNEENVKISAQKYLKEFYQSHNFKQIGDEYLEDNIPHLAMINY